MRQWQSTLISATQRPYLCRLWVPESPAPAQGFPLLVMLDGDWIQHHIESFVECQPRPINFAIASIGFNVARQAARQRRSYDYTPVPPPPHAPVDPRMPDWAAGGADELVQFIRTQLLPQLQQQASLDLNRLGLFGHSYGGLFTLYTLLTYPNLFKHYIAASPSLWWYHPFMQNQAVHLPPLQRSTQLNVLIGDQEQWRPKPADPTAPRPAGIPTSRFLDAFMDQLPYCSQLKTQRHRFPDADHGAMLGLATAFALREFAA